MPHVRASVKKETIPKTSLEGKLPIGQGDIHEQDKEK
jgi:hypothetical protein